MRRALLVEDDPKFRMLVRYTLSELDFEIAEVTHIDRAKDTFNSEHFDLLIVDGLLPDGSGIEFIKQARNDGYSGPIFFISEFWKSPEIFRTLTDKWLVTRVLAKPLTVAQLALEVKAVFPIAAGVSVVDSATRDASASNESKNLERELAALRSSYAAEFPASLLKLERAVEAAAQSGSEKDPANEAHRLAHSLSGSAGSFGFRESSNQLRSVEMALEAILEEFEQAPADAWAPIGATLEQVRISFDDEWEKIRTREARIEAASTERVQSQALSCAPRVLVVDDDESVLQNLQLIASQHMIEVVPAKTEREAVALAADGRVSAAILDVNLANGKSGYDVAVRLRSFPHLAELPLAFFSVDSSMSSRVKAAHAGGSVFLDKAQCEDEFAGVVRRLVALATTGRPKLLIVSQDAEASNELAAQLSGEELDASVTSDTAGLLDTVANLRPAALLVSEELESVSGYEICKMVRTTTAWQDLPIVLLTADDSRQIRSACFDAGADDYVSTPPRVEELAERVKVLIDRQSLRRERADRDGLTGLMTRRAFLETCGARLVEAQRNQEPLALCLLDLDHFKLINDRYGHEAGDNVLRTLGGLLASRFRVFDIRGRWGGEEFAVVLFRERPRVVERVLLRILEEFRLIGFEAEGGEIFHATFSAGIAFYPDDGGNLRTLFRVADARLYEAKHLGRDRIEIASAGEPRAVGEKTAAAG